MITTKTFTIKYWNLNLSAKRNGTIENLLIYKSLNRFCCAFLLSKYTAK